MKKKKIIALFFVVLLTLTMGISVFAYVDRATGTVGGYFTEGLIYNGLNGGYCASSYVNTSSSNIYQIWAKVELVVSGTLVTKEKYGSSNSVDTDEATSTLYVASVRGYHYIELSTGEIWGSKTSCLTSYIT